MQLEKFLQFCPIIAIDGAQFEEFDVQALMSQINRGCTLLKAQGGYSGADQKMILCTLRRDELFHLRQVTFTIDPDAFVMVLSTDEVRGLGFLHPNQE